jgi:hypothetical protein
MDGLPIDLGGVLGELVEPALLGPPVVTVDPVPGQTLDIVEWYPVFPAGEDGTWPAFAAVHLVEGQLIGPTGPGDAVEQVVEIFLGDVDGEGLDGGHDVSFRN